MFHKKQNKKLQTIYPPKLQQRGTRYSRQASGGFTLIEILLVTFITGLVFISVYLLYASTIKQDVESRYEIIASNLAQEGVEIIRNKRDEEILAGNDIDHGLPGVCKPRLYDLSLSPCGNPGTSTEVGFDNAGGRYINCQGTCAPGLFTKTPFTRECTITASDQDVSIPGNDTLEVFCTVSWKSFVNPNIVRKVEAVSVLTDWGAD